MGVYSIFNFNIFLNFNVFKFQFFYLINSFSPFKKTKQSNSPQKKEHEATAARDLTNTDTSKMSEPEFRITIIRILAGVKNRLDSLSEEIREVKKKKNSQNEIKNAITELQSWMDAVAARMDKAEQRISDIQNKLMENN